MLLLYWKSCSLRCVLIIFISFAEISSVSICLEKNNSQTVTCKQKQTWTDWGRRSPVSRTTSIKKGIYIQPMNLARIQIHSVCLSPSERSQTALKFDKET